MCFPLKYLSPSHFFSSSLISTHLGIDGQFCNQHDTVEEHGISVYSLAVVLNKQNRLSFLLCSLMVSVLEEPGFTVWGNAEKVYPMEYRCPKEIFETSLGTFLKKKKKSDLYVF